MIVGTAGHIDHGKTSLIRKLTGIDTDRLKEEKARGISIDLGFAYWPRPGGAIVGFVDVPGHEALVHNMLAGATGIDFVILVVAADDSVMPQTREHLAIMDLLGLERGVVALTKCDLVDDKRLLAVSREVESLLEDTSLKGAEVIPVSAVSGAGLDALVARIDAAVAASTVRPREGRFRLAVDRSFTLAGYGPAVTGTVLSGAVRVGDHVRVSPAGLDARVRSIHAQNQPVEEGEAGQRCALVLSGPRIGKEALHRGDMVLDAVLDAPTARIDASLRVLPSERKPIGQWFPVKVHHAAAEVPGRIVVLSDEPIVPGDTALVQLVLDRPLAADGRRPVRASRYEFQPHGWRRHVYRPQGPGAAPPHARALRNARSSGGERSRSRLDPDSRQAERLDRPRGIPARPRHWRGWRGRHRLEAGSGLAAACAGALT